MPSVLDQRIGIGEETTYGTAVAPARHYEASADAFTRSVERIDTSGFRQSRQAQRADRDRQVTMGASGSLDVPFFMGGMGLLLKHMLGASTDPVAAGGAQRAVFETNTDGPTGSYTTQVVRAIDQAVEAFDYAGCITTGFNLAVDQGGYLKLMVNFDAQSEAKNAAPTAGIYPAGLLPFIWEDCSLTVGGTAVADIQNFSLDGEMMLRTDLHFLKNSALKNKPIRNAAPTFSGSMEVIPSSLDQYDQFVDADDVAIVLTATNGGTGAALRSVEVRLAACKLTGSTPQSSPSDLTTMSLPFTAFHNGSDPVVRITTISADTAF